MDERRDFDCLDFKLMLTALVDGTAPPEGRQTAERHALACPACLRLLEEAESTDFMLKLSARSESAALPEGFADRVIEGTRRESSSAHADTAGRVGTRWREGAAWLAAAAALAFAVIASVDRPSLRWGRSASASITPIAAPVFSGVRDLTDADLAGAMNEAARTESIAALLETLADAIDDLTALDASDAAAAAALSQRISNETLLARASLLRISLAPETRADLQAAEAAMLSLTAGCLDAMRLEELQSNLRAVGLAQRLRDMARSLPRVLAAA
ncbi:MAG: hypothetical protein FJ253_04925 [Phycisphaerae bacterium]|nr:hypothetical protein [Phycisphaerae bacterium]